MKKSASIILLIFLIGGMNGFSQVNLDSALVAKYYFNGNANDESGNGLDGTVNGPSLTTDRFGIENSAYLFDSISDIEVANDPLLTLTMDFTFSIWVNQDTATGNGYRLIDKVVAGQSAGYNFDTYGQGSGHRMRMTSSSIAIANTDYPLDTWNHLLVTVHDNSATFYLNGVFDGQSSYSTPATNDLTLLIGAAHFNSDNNFVGVLDDIRIYNRAIHDDEIQALYLENTVGVFEITHNPITIYPNPANETIHIEGLTIGEVEIINLQGQVIRMINTAESKSSINISTLAKGAYTLRIKTENGIVLKKLIKN